MPAIVISAHASAKTLTAVARELAGFIWAMGQLLEEVPTAA
jgi:hypothetical protein